MAEFKINLITSVHIWKHLRIHRSAMKTLGCRIGAAVHENKRFSYGNVVKAPLSTYFYVKECAIMNTSLPEHVFTHT